VAFIRQSCPVHAEALKGQKVASGNLVWFWWARELVVCEYCLQTLLISIPVG